MSEIEGPKVSVVVASFTGPRALARCLESLARQPEDAPAPVEILVAVPARDEGARDLPGRHPELITVPVPGRADVFALRAAGVARARGEVVALLEDHATAGPRWLPALVQAHHDGHGVLGGPVDYGSGGWALYFCEYGLYMPPMDAGPVPALSGVNAAYDRELLASCRSTWRRAFHENEVHAALQAAGHTLYLVPEASIASHLRMSPLAAVRHLFSGGRQFAGWRRGGETRTVALLRALASPAVPWILLGRVARRIASRRPLRLLRLLVASPLVLVLLSAWAAGEARGYLDPGDRGEERE